MREIIKKRERERKERAACSEREVFFFSHSNWWPFIVSFGRLVSRSDWLMAMWSVNRIIISRLILIIFFLFCLLLGFVWPSLISRRIISRSSIDLHLQTQIVDLVLWYWCTFYIGIRHGVQPPSWVICTCADSSACSFYEYKNCVRTSANICSHSTLFSVLWIVLYSTSIAYRLFSIQIHWWLRWPATVLTDNKFTAPPCKTSEQMRSVVIILMKITFWPSS